MELAKAVFERTEHQITGHITGASGCSVRLVNCILSKAEGAVIEQQGNDTILKIAENDVTVVGNF